MFEKVTKYFASKATDGAVEGVKSTINEKIDQHWDVIRIGLVVAVVILGGRHITKKNENNFTGGMAGNYTGVGGGPGSAGGYLPQRAGQGSPIVINNYYPDFQGNYQRSVQMERRNRYGQGTSYQRNQKRR